MKDLIRNFAGSANTVIAHIESTFVVDPMSPAWGTESVLVAIDTVLKGSVPNSSYWFVHQLWEDSGIFGSLKGKKFIGFFNEIKANDVLGLGEPSPCFYEWRGGRGYFIESGRIVNTGPDAMLGVSVSLPDWLAAISRIYQIVTFGVCTDSIPSVCYYILAGVRDTISDSVRDIMSIRDTTGKLLSADDPIAMNGIPIRGFFLVDTFFITEVLSQSLHTNRENVFPADDRHLMKHQRMFFFTEFQKMPRNQSDAIIDIRGRCTRNQGMIKSIPSGIYFRIVSRK